MKIKRTLGDESLKSVFGKIIGTEKPDDAIIIPKCIKARLHISRIVRALKILTSPKIRAKLPESSKRGLDEVNMYIEQLWIRHQFDEVKIIDPTNVTHLYKEVKSEFTQKLLNTAATLLDHVGALKNFDWEPIIALEIPFVPFSFAPLFDLYPVFISETVGPDTKKYLMEMLKWTKDEVDAYYKIFRSPDVNPRDLGETLIKHMSVLKQHVPRCEKAFDAISKSINTFETKFDSYYSEFVTTKNSASMMEAYVMDLKDQHSNDPKMIFQFKKIIQFLQKRSQESSNQGTSDPAVKAIFSKLDSSIKDAESSIKEDNSEEKK